MGSLQVQVKPENPGSVTVKVALASSPGGTPINETFEVDTNNPLDKTWDVEPALYAVTISWNSGYHNISGAAAGNGIVVNGNRALYYQVLGDSGYAMFGAEVT